MKKLLEVLRGKEKFLLYQAFVPLADVTASPLAPLYTGGPGDLSDYLNRIFLFAIGLGAVAAVLRLAYAGYLYMGQADMWSHKGEARRIIGDVTLGLLLLLGVWLILNQINPEITRLKALDNLPQLQQKQSSGTPPFPSTQGHVEGSACTTDAGLPGQWSYGQCVWFPG